MIGPHPISLRFRLTASAGLIAGIAVFAALLAAYGAAETAQRIHDLAAAQRRIDALSALSARVSDYAVVAVESSMSQKAAGTARLESRAALVADAFERMDAEIAAAVLGSAESGKTEQMRLATRSLGTARMEMLFDVLRTAVEDYEGNPNLRVTLDGFATQFAPLLNEAITAERHDRNAAADGVSALHNLMLLLAFGSAAVAISLAAAFHLILHRSLIAQIDRVAAAAEQIGKGAFAIKLPVRRRDELGRLLETINAMAARLQNRRAEVDCDRARLNEIIEARTAELSAANARLCAIDAERRGFFAEVGHELRTPLTVILAEAELAMKDGSDLKEVNSALSVIRTRALGLNRRVEDLLRIARSDSGQIELDSQPFDLARAAAAAADDMASLVKSRQVSLINSLEASPVLGDADWCRQLFSGLIENAARHSSVGGIIELATSVTNGTVLATVTDEGEGLDREECAHVFNRFARGSREITGSGFGVGLSLARWIIERHNGSIMLLSPAPRPPKGGRIAGRGAQVVIRLPLHEEINAAH